MKNICLFITSHETFPLGTLMAVISAARTAIVTKSLVSILISTIYPPRKVTLHNFGEPYYITSDNLTKPSALIYEMLMSFIFPSLAMSRCPEMSVTTGFLFVSDCLIFINYHNPIFSKLKLGQI